MSSANRACSTDAEVDRPQDAISENDVAHAKVSEREPCRGAVEPAGYHPRSCLGLSPCRALASKGIERGHWRRFRASAHALRLREPVPRSSRITRYNNVIISRTAKCRTNGALIDPTAPAFASRTDKSRRDRLPARQCCSREDHWES
jgi:hypothetical protein